MVQYWTYLVPHYIGYRLETSVLVVYELQDLPNRTSPIVLGLDLKLLKRALKAAPDITSLWSSLC